MDDDRQRAQPDATPIRAFGYRMGPLQSSPEKTQIEKYIKKADPQVGFFRFPCFRRLQPSP
jgi:hypothetical protein